MGSHEADGWFGLYLSYFDNTLDRDITSKANGCTDIRIICANGDQVSCSGLPYMASVSILFKLAGGWGDGNATFFMPDYSASVVGKILGLLTQGSINFAKEEGDDLRDAMKALGVSYQCFIFVLYVYALKKKFFLLHKHQRIY